jgi:hypothetical protein
VKFGASERHHLRRSCFGSIGTSRNFILPFVPRQRLPGKSDCEREIDCGRSHVSLWREGLYTYQKFGPEGAESTLADTYKVAKTKVVQLENGAYSVEFEFDDAFTDFAEVGSKETADFFATEQTGEAIVIGANPLLLNAEKAETLRQRSKNSDN